jgi:putative ABC transport system permease protein
MRTLIQDLRHGVRLLRRAPGFAALAVSALAIGIGANTAVFSVVNAVLLKRLPYEDPDRLALVWERNIPRNRITNPVSPGNFLHWREMNHSFTDLAAVSGSFNFTLTGAGDPVEVPGQLVSGQFFSVLGVRPLLGRLLTIADDRPNNHVAVISERLWSRRFNRDPGVLERPVNFAGDPFTIAGILPAEFSYMDRTVDLWAPIGFRAETRTPRGRGISVLGRLKPGVTVSQAQQDLSGVHAELTRMFPAFNTGWTTNVVPLKEQMTGEVKPALAVLLAAVALLLLTACANVANLLLARATSRQRELAVRAALGAGRGRIARQLLAESAVLAVVGGVAGLLLAWWALHILRTVVAQRLAVQRLDLAGIDGWVLVFTIGASLLSALLFGALPALAGARDLNAALKEGGRTGSGARGGRARAAFVVVEIVLALVLLVGSGLLLRSFTRLVGVDPGFDPGHTLTMRLSLPGARYDDGRRMQFYRRLFDRIDAVPGVQSAGAVSFLPLTGLASATRIEIVGKPIPPLGQEPVADVRVVSHDYFRAMGVPLLKGRLFNDDDPADAQGRIVVNATLARQHWPGEDPIGKRISVSWGERKEDEVIGVVGDMRHAGLDAAARATTYWPYARNIYGSMSLAIRAAGDGHALANSMIEVVRLEDSQLAVSDVRTMDEVVSVSVAQKRLLMLLVSIFAGAALILVAVGIYGVIAYNVTERTQEIGIRMALGAQRAAVLRMIVGQALLLAVAGVVLGSIGASLLTRLLTGFLFQVDPTDPLTFTAVAGLVLTVALAASSFPGLRATRVDPVVALRGE